MFIVAVVIKTTLPPIAAALFLSRITALSSAMP
jgi:hypothetical protein